MSDSSPAAAAAVTLSDTELPLTSAVAPPDYSNAAKWLVLFAALLGWMFDGVEMGLFPLVARPALLELMGPGAQQHIGTWMSWVIAGFLLGAAAGGVIFGWLGDRIGRVRAMTWSVLVYSVFSGLCGFSTQPWHLAVLRFLASLGMGGEWALGVALVMEVWPARSRPLMAGLIGAAANVGFLGIALLGLVLASFLQQVGHFLGLILPAAWVEALMANHSWRLLLFLGAVPAVFTFCVRLFVPESRRWEHAAQHAPKNRLVDIFQPGIARSTIMGAVLSAIALLGTWGSVQWIPSWARKLVGPEASSSAAAAAQIASGLGACFGCVLGALLAQWLSRRIAYFAMTLASLLCCEILFLGHTGYGTMFLVWVFLVGGTTAAFYGWLPLYLPELFPTRVRATGQGFAFNIGRVLAAGGTFVSGTLLNAFHEDYARMASWITLVYLAGLLVIWLAPETKGRPLPE
jgi:MFS family permease